ncbi:MAG: shikimate dehydrogenase [Chitinophagaceae bacterium]|nr:MAG: shikimate dehydrogenase [Chitinophagaceae bacterium]
MNLYGLIGYPLGHSFSKEYFNRKFETEGLVDYFFESFPLEDIRFFPDFLKTNPALKGLAVTIPYKEAVIPYLNQLTPEATEIGAVNCIEFLPGILKGHNTDVIGFRQSFERLLQPHHTKALILGTGGASKAAQYVLRQMNIPYLLVSRKPDDGMLMYEDVKGSLLREYPILVNCSPVGMHPLEQASPNISYQDLDDGNYLFDMIYKPAETVFLQQGKERGSVVKNGYEMLLLQAEANWKIWNANRLNL